MSPALRVAEKDLSTQCHKQKEGKTGHRLGSFSGSFFGSSAPVGSHVGATAMSAT